MDHPKSSLGKQKCKSYSTSLTILPPPQIYSIYCMVWYSVFMYTVVISVTLVQIGSDCLVNFHFIKLVEEVSIRWYIRCSCLTAIITLSHGPHTSLSSKCHPLCSFVTNILDISQCVKMKCGTYILVKPPDTKFHQSLDSGSCSMWTFSHSKIHIFLQLFSSKHTINNKFLSLNQDCI